MRSLFLFFSILSEKSVLSLYKVGTYLNQHHKVSVDFKTQQKKDPRNTYKTQRNCLPLHRSRLEDSSLYRIMIVFGEGGAVRRTICIAEPKCRFLGEQWRPLHGDWCVFCLLIHCIIGSYFVYLSIKNSIIFLPWHTNPRIPMSM